MLRGLFMQFHLLQPLLLLLSLTMVTAMPLCGVEYDNNIEDLVEGRDFDVITRLVKKLDVEENIKWI